MKFHQPLESQRLSFLLEKAASREAQMWKVYVSKTPSSQIDFTVHIYFPKDTHISPAERDEAVRWLSALHSKIKLYPETLSLAIGILDRFLAIVKARPKYLRCIAITCFFLAIKTSEEDERIPSLRDLARTSSCGCSPSEILRMERIVLDKLNWDLHMATPLDFLQIFHAMALSCKSQFLVSLLGMNPSQHMLLLTRQLHHCMANHTLLEMKGSMLALALVTLELEKCCPDWLALTIDLLKKAQIDSSQQIRCREMVARFLFPHQASLPPNTVYIYQPLCHSPAPCRREARRPQHPLSAPPPSVQVAPPPCHLTRLPHQPIGSRVKHSAKRKVEEMELDEFYDGIKRLYNEDLAQEGLVGEDQSFAFSTSPCPPLQPVRVA